MAEPGLFSRLHVLIVDDHEMMRMMLTRAFTAAQAASVRTAESGARALELHAARAADLIIADRKMPGMDGLELLRTIRASANQPRFVLLTGQTGSEDEGRAAGADLVLVKPVTPRALFAAIETLY